MTRPSPVKPRWYDSPAVPAAIIVIVVAVVAAIPPAPIRAGEPTPGQFSFEPVDTEDASLTQSRLLEVDTETGSVAWAQEFESSAFWFGATPDALVGNYRDAASPGLFAVSTTGDSTWQNRIGEDTSRQFGFHPELLDNGVAVVVVDETQPDRRSVLIGLDGATGRELWTREMKTRLQPYAFLGDAMVFVERERGIAAIDTLTGEDLWTADVQCRWNASSGNAVSITAFEDAVYVYIGGCPFDKLFRVDAAGAIQEIEIDEKPRSVNLAAGLLVVQEGRRLRALNPEDGRTEWRRRGLAEDFQAIGDVGLITAPRNRALIGIDLQKGEELWRFPIDRNDIIRTAATEVFLVSRSSRTETVLIAIDPESGEIAWEETLAGSLLQMPIEHQGDLVVGVKAPKNDRLRRTGPSFIAGLDPATGGESWRQVLEWDVAELVVDSAGVFVMEIPFRYEPARTFALSSTAPTLQRTLPLRSVARARRPNGPASRRPAHT